jgi:5-methylcytosine-specific restriction protein B
MILHERLFGELKDLHRKLMDEGELRSRQQLAQYYATFQDRFGIDRLQTLDGELLLNTIHDFSSTDSLGYWLEYKNDEELPAIFGSIAGGSALKYGIYRRKETGAWMTGPPGNQREISLEEAIQIAREQRDQLARGAELLEGLPANGNDEDYQHLQEGMDDVASDVSDKAWGHKYLHMLYPDKLDDYHVQEYQRFHLIKLLQVPPEGQGRYAAGGRYVSIAEELEIPLNHLAAILNRRNGRPHSYWRTGTSLGGTDSRWEVMRYSIKGADSRCDGCSLPQHPTGRWPQHAAGLPFRDSHRGG